MNLIADNLGIAGRRPIALSCICIATLQYFLINTFYVGSSTAHFSWPNGHIPYLDDLALIADPDQAVALNNARMDLQVRSCVRFYPRRLERDFVFFTDLGPQVECWNMFDHPKGRVEVNAGPSCLEPMRRPHRPHRVFSDCDIEYVNHLYNCPRRRSISPICPPGQNIMSRPQLTTSMATTEMMSVTFPLPTTTTTINFTPKAAIEATHPAMTTSLVINPGMNGSVWSTITTISSDNKEEMNQSTGYIEDNNMIDQTTPFDTSTRFDSASFYKLSRSDENGVRGIGELGEETDEYRHHRKISSNGNDIDFELAKESRINTTRIMTTEHPDWHNYEDTKTSEEEEWKMSHAYETTTMELEPDYIDNTIRETLRPEDKRFPTAETDVEEEYSTVTITTIPQPSFPTLIHPRSTHESISPSSNFLPDTDGLTWQPQQKPLPLPHTQLMMTLITTPSTTTTTFAPPPPDWVRSVEASFESRQNGERAEIDSMTTPIYATIDADVKPQSLNAPNAVSVEVGGFSSAGSAHASGKENYSTNLRPSQPSSAFGGDSWKTNKFVLPQLGNFTAADGRNVIMTSDSGENSKLDGEYSVSQTKVITTIEKSKYVGPCGSACSYSGDLVKLYKSYNQKSEVTDHFYTTDRLEHHLMASQGYTMKPNVGYLGRNHVDPLCSCLKPLYRLYNDFMKDHLLTSVEHEKDMAERILGYKFERVLGFCTKEPGCGAYVPLYRFYNPISKDHLYTSDQQEMHYYKTHPEQAYGFENIECYIWQHNSSVKSCPALMLAAGRSRSS